jgi:hypothetical protein
VRIALLVILAGISYASGLWALLCATRQLVPGVTLKDVATPSGPGQDEGERLGSLYTPRGVQLQRVGMVSVSVCALAVVLALINLGSRLPSIIEANSATNANALVLEISNRPGILLIWVAELILAALGFACSRSRPLLAIPFVALAIMWYFDLTRGFRGPQALLMGTQTERAYTLQVGLATIIVLLATAQGMRSWMVRANKRAERTALAV